MTTQSNRKLEDVLSEMEAMLSVSEQWHDIQNFDDWSIVDIARYFWRIRDLRDRAKDASTRLFKIYDSLDKAIFPAQLEKRELDMVRVPDMARSFSIRTNTSASMLDKEQGVQWLRENGHGDIVQETVNAQTLASFAKNLLLEEGRELPEEIFKVSTYNSMGSNKYTPKETA